MSLSGPTSEAPRRGRPSPMMFISLGAGTVVAVVLIVVVSLLTGGRVTSPSASTNALVGTHLADFRETGLSGATVNAPYATHHPTIFLVFASWCDPCKKEIPRLAAWLASHSTGRVDVVGVDYQDAPASARAFVTRSALRIPIMQDGSGNVVSGIFHLAAGIPDTVVVSAQGVVTNVIPGPLSTSALARAVSSLQG